VPEVALIVADLLSIDNLGAEHLTVLDVASESTCGGADIGWGARFVHKRLFGPVVLGVALLEEFAIVCDLLTPVLEASTAVFALAVTVSVRETLALGVCVTLLLEV